LWINLQNNLHSAGWRSKTNRKEYGSFDSKIFSGKYQYCSYILYKFGQERSSDSKDYEGSNCTFLGETPKIAIFHQISQSLLVQAPPNYQHW